MSNLVKHGSYEMEEAEKEEAELGKGKTEFLKLEQGRNVIRFLPPAAGKKSPFRVIYQHYVDVPGATGPVVFTCPRMESKQQCPSCAQADKFRKSGNPVDRERAFEMLPSRRVMANVIDRKDPEAGPKVLGFGKKIHEALIALRKDADAGGDFTDPMNGFDIIIERTGAGRTDTKYAVLGARKLSPLGNDEWIEQQHDLDAFARVRALDEIEAALRGEETSGRGERGRQQAAAPAKPPTRPPPTRAESVMEAEFEEPE